MVLMGRVLENGDGDFNTENRRAAQRMARGVTLASFGPPAGRGATKPTMSSASPRYERKPAYATGRRTLKVLPCPISLRTSTVPPCASTSVFTMDSPRPAPPNSRERALSTR